MSREFTAQWGGRCEVCGRGIRAGDRVHFVEDELCHILCDADAPPTRGASESICPECFLTSCDCGADS